MKNSKYYLKTLLLLITIGIFNSGCKKDQTQTTSCVSQTSSELSTVNVFDGRIGSLYYNFAIANFAFSQAVNSYSNNCGQTTYGSTSLVITNTINKTITISYKVIATIGIVTWTYQNVSVIAPNSAMNLQVINSNQQRLHIGQIIIQLSNIVYS